MTDVETTTVPSTEPHPPTRASVGEILGWVLLLGLTVWALTGTLSHEYDHRPIVGDQASNVMQMLSVAHDGNNLSYDQLDVDRWKALHWFSHPHGLYFQGNDDGWAFAKPYGYSITLVVPYRLFGSPVGVAVANSLLLVALVGIAVATLRLRLRGAAVPLVSAAFVYASNAYMHAFPAVVDLFTAVVVGLGVYALLRGLRDESLRWQAVGFAVFGFLLSEKLPLLVAFAPLVGLCLWRARSLSSRLLLGASTIVVLAVSVVPYLYYSDGRTWSAYGGERYYAGAGVPFDEDFTGDVLRVDSDDTITLSYVWSRVTSPSSWVDSAQSSIYYLVGRHTGLLVSFPIALLAIALALMRGRALPAEAVAALAGIGLYVVFYLALFPENYYGGGQSIGNRYFLQIAPLVLGVVAFARIPAKALVGASVAAGVLSLSLMWPHHERPTWALVDLEKTSWAQQFLPFETNQIGAPYWRCGFGVCDGDDE